MTGEEWNAYLATLDEETRALAMAIMRRVTRLLNRDRSAVLDDIQRLELRQGRATDRIGELREDVSRYVAQQDRLEERLDLVEPKVEALAMALASVQRERGSDGG